MTPRDLDTGVVQARLRLIDELLDDLERAGELTGELLTRDRMLRHAIERILSQIVELAVSVNGHVSATVLGKAPADYRSSFDLAAAAGLIDRELSATLQPSVGLRNVLAPEYVDVDLELVVLAARKASIDYRSYVRTASEWLRRR
ncbi:MAG: type VII toxin-antitoxin system HepT family RNase toxin [Nocardioidaceae bacterium]